MAAENFKVKKGLEVGTGITANSDGVNVTGIVTATQFKGDGSGLTGVVGSGSGIVVKDEGSAVGTAGTVNFVGSGVAATLSAGTATVTINAGGLDNVVEDTTPELGGNLNLNSKFVTGSGGINVTGVVTATTLKGNGDFVDIDVDGHTELDNTNIVGIVTVTNVSSGIGLKLIDSSSKQFFAGGGGGGSPFAGSSTGHDFRIQVGGLQNAIFKYAAGATGNLELGPSSGIGITFNGASGNANYAGIITATGANITGIATFTGGVAKLLFDGNQKLTTTINGIEVPDLNVTGVGTVGRLETSGVTLGTNNNTFAAKFIDDAVANFGTDNDLKISHDDTHARITNTKGDIVVSGIISATSDVKVGSAITMDPTSGIITATKFVGDGSGLTGVTASGSGVVVKHDGSTVGTAGTINFSTNLDVTPISAGIVTVTASGGGSNASTFTVTANNSTDETVYPIFVDGTTGSQGAESDTNLSYNPSSNILTAGTFSGNLSGTVNTAAQTNITSLGTLSSLTVSGDVTANGNIVGDNSTNISGIASVTATSFHGSGIGLTSLNADNLGSGEIPSGRFPSTLPTISGANLTNLNADNISSGTLASARIEDNAVTFDKLEDVANNRILGNVSGSSGSADELTAAQVRTLLNVADGATAGITTAPSNVVLTWDVVNQSASAYRFTGPGQDGSSNNPDIYLVRGNKYRFSVSASGHPFWIKTSATTGVGNSYNDGVTNNGAQSGNVEFYVQNDAPAQLYYICQAHGGMVGNIYTTGHQLTNGANDRILTATSAYGMNGEANLTFDGSTLNNTNGGANFTKSANNYILVGSTNASGASLVLDGDSNGDGSGTDYAFLTHNTDGDLDIVVDNPANAGNIKFFTNSSSERVRITGIGSFGVGINAPVAQFQVNSTKNAETDRFHASNYHLALRNPADDTGEAIGISFGITSNIHKVGASILHERDGGGSQGSLQFYTSSDGNSISEAFRIDSGQRLLLGYNTSQTVYAAAKVQIQGTDGNSSSLSLLRHGNSPYLILGSTGGSSLGDTTALSDGDRIGQLTFAGADGTDIATHAASIAAYVEGSVSGNDVPAAIAFQLGTSEGEKMRLDNHGTLRIGNAHDQTTSGNTKRIALGAKASIWGWASGQINGALTLADNYYWDGVYNKAIESDYSAYLTLRSGSVRYGSTDAANTAGGNSSTITERFRLIQNDLRHGSTNVLANGLDDVRIRNGSSYKGFVLRGTGGSGGMANHNEYCFLFNRMGTDGDIVQLYAQGSKEGSISVSGSSVAYNGGVLTRWSQLVGISTNNKADRPTIYQGTVMSNLDVMCEWPGEENMQLNKTEVSTVSGDKNVAGVFWTWDDDDDTYVNDFYIAQTGDYIIRVGAATTVTRGDLLESAGDGTAKPQSDDIVRSKTVAKVTSGIAHTTYPDGTKTYPCVLMGS